LIFSGKYRCCSGTFTNVICIAANKEYLTKILIAFRCVVAMGLGQCQMVSPATFDSSDAVYTRDQINIHLLCCISFAVLLRCRIRWTFATRTEYT